MTEDRVSHCWHRQEER